MKVAIIGPGGREFALCWKLKEEKNKVWSIGGNFWLKDVEIIEDLNFYKNDEFLNFLKKESIELVVCGSEEPIAWGVADLLKKEGIKVFGPSKKLSLLEASKIFGKEFSERNQIPTAKWMAFDNFKKALKYIESCQFPLVIKADGLCAGKGSFICEDKTKAYKVLEDLMENKIFSSAGERVVIEEFLEGDELSYFTLIDANEYVNLIPVVDYKKAYDGDKGPNTGGMGAVASKFLYPDLQQEIEQKIIKRAYQGLLKEGEYRGVLYFGLMLTKEGPKVLEYNVRFGDPEFQAQVLLLKTPLLEILDATAKGELRKIKTNIEYKEKCWGVCVVLTSDGYPGSFKKGFKIIGIEDIESDRIFIFQAGVKKINNEYLTNAGRVLNVVGACRDLLKILNKIYQKIEKIRFHGMHYRKDIGKKFAKCKKLRTSL